MIMDARGGARVKSTGRGKAHKSTDYQPKRVPVQCVFGWWEWSSKRGTKGDPGDLLRQSTSPFCGSINTRVHQNIKKFSEFYSHLIYICCIYMKEDQKKQKTKYFWDVLLAWPRFCRKEYFLQNGGLAQKIIFFCIFGLLLYRYNIYISSENIILKTF